MRWVKSTAKATMDAEKSAGQAGELSDDPFGDIESLRDEPNGGREGQREASPSSTDLLSPSPSEEDDIPAVAEMSRIEERSEVEDEEELELSNFSTDASAHVVDIMTGVEADDYDDDDETTDSGDAEDLHTATQAQINDIDYDSEFEDSPSRNNITDAPPVSIPGPSSQSQAFLAVQPPAVTLSTPNRGNSVAGTPVIKSALKSGSATPTSVLKNSYRHSYQTPNHRKVHQRSVSFSDGKRDGPIQGKVAIGANVEME